MKRFKVFYDKDKETAWLNEMAAQGWMMVHFFLCFYTFEPCEKGEYIYQLDFDERCRNGAENYDAFMNEMGITVVDNWFLWTYLRKRAEDGPFELYTDTESQIAQYTKIRNLFKIVAVLDFICAAIEAVCGAVTGTSLPFFAFILLCILGCVIANAAFTTDKRIRELKGQPAKPQENRHMWPMLCLLSSCLILLSRRVESNTFSLTLDFLAGAVLGLAAVVIFFTFKEKK